MKNYQFSLYLLNVFLIEKLISFYDEKKTKTYKFYKKILNQGFFKIYIFENLSAINVIRRGSFIFYQRKNIKKCKNISVTMPMFLIFQPT